MVFRAGKGRLLNCFAFSLSSFLMLLVYLHCSWTDKWTNVAPADWTQVRFPSYRFLCNPVTLALQLESVFYNTCRGICQWKKLIRDWMQFIFVLKNPAVLFVAYACFQSIYIYIWHIDSCKLFLLNNWDVKKCSVCPCIYPASTLDE